MSSFEGSDDEYEDLSSYYELSDAADPPVTANKPNFQKIAPNYSLNLLEFARTCYKEGKLSDISVQVGDKTCKTHSIVISMASEYFKTLLQMESEKKDTIVLTGIDSEIFEQILEFAYAGSMDFTDLTLENVQDLTIAADFLSVLALKELCEEFLSEFLSYLQ